MQHCHSHNYLNQVEAGKTEQERKQGGVELGYVLCAMFTKPWFAHIYKCLIQVIFFRDMRMTIIMISVTLTKLTK